MKRVSTALSSWSSECKVKLAAEEESRGERRRREERKGEKRRGQEKMWL